MAERQSVLTGRSGPAPVRAAANEPQNEVGQELKAAIAAIDLLKAELERRGGELSAAHADLRDARADAEVRIQALRQQLGEATDTLSQAQADLAAERATSVGLRAQLDGERTAGAALQERLAEAIAAAAVPHQTTVQSGQPVAYEMVIGERDGNNRVRTVSLKPVEG